MPVRMRRLNLWRDKMANSCRSKQIKALKQMLNLNQPVTKASISEPVWKVLVYDRFGQDIISPLLTVKELRELGITLHLQLHSDRDVIPEVPAIYFVFPTDENIQRICQDLSNGIYETYYLNFISPISRHKLEDLASAALQSNAVPQIAKICDQYLNFISLEDDLFTVKHHNRESISYYALNKPDARDSEIESVCDTLVDALFSFLATSGTVPVIRCPRGNAAEMIAEALDKKIRENLRDTRNSLFTTDIQSGNFSFQRPVLVLLDRNIDLCTPLHHTWTYQALCHDVLDYQLNRVSLKETDTKNGDQSVPNRQTKIKKYDFANNDKFWLQHKGSPFPSVAESIQKELDDYRASEDEVKRLKHAVGAEGEDEEIMEEFWNDNTAKLTSAVSSLPELLERKRLIDMHTNVAMALLEEIKSRKLDVYFEAEEKVMSKSSADKTIMEIIQDPAAGTPDDKLRLFIIYFISGPTLSPAELGQYMAALQEAGCNTSAMDYIKKWKAFSKISSGPIQTGGGQSTYSTMFSNIMTKGSQFVMEGVKNLAVGTKNLPITRIVDALMDNKSTQETEEYRYFDPKMLKGGEIHAAPKNKTPFEDAVVFVVGGGNYIEYINLVNYEKRQTSNNKKITYGCSELLNANQFLKQLSSLGSD